jgi:hypothetical protein
MDNNSKRTPSESVSFHVAAALDAWGMSNAAHGVGDRLAGNSYAQTATWHEEQAKKFRELV